MQVNLIGLGSGQEETRSLEAQRALEQAELVLGAERLLQSLPAVPGQTRIAAVRPEEDGESFEEIAAACEELMKCRSS